MLSANRLFVAHDVAGHGVSIREFARAPGALDWTTAVPVAVPLPAGYADIYAIYPETDAYRTTPVGGVNFAIVGSTRDNEVLGVFAIPP